VNQQRGEVVRLVVPGEPIPMARPRIANHGRVYTPAKTKNYQKRIATVATLLKLSPAVGPVEVSCWFSLPRNKDGSETRKHGDLDNYAKNCLDALSHLAYDDDKQVVRLIAERVDGSLEGWTAIEVREVLDLTGEAPGWAI